MPSCITSQVSARAEGIREVSEAMSRSLDTPIERVRVIITEMPKNRFGIGGEPASKVRR